MKTFSLLTLSILFSFTKIFSQITLLPFVGKDKSEVVLAYNTSNGKSMEWYYDNTLKKMAKANSGFQLPADFGLTGAVESRYYIDPTGTEVLLAWNPATGKSVSWYYDEANKKMTKSEAGYQLPEKLGLTGTIMMRPYVGADKSEVVLVWETKTGKSIQFYYDVTLKKFNKADAKFQLPASVGLTGEIMMHPYIGNDGSEITLIWSKTTGQSVAWYLNNAQGKYIKAEPNYQLPSCGYTGNVMMYPYVGKDGSEIILTWNVATGQSTSFYFENSTKKFTRSAAQFQLPAAPVAGTKIMICPFINQSGDEIIYTWNAAAGQSANYYYDNTLQKFTKSKSEFQLPVNPL